MLNLTDKDADVLRDCISAGGFANADQAIAPLDVVLSDQTAGLNAVEPHEAATSVVRGTMVMVSEGGASGGPGRGRTPLRHLPSREPRLLRPLQFDDSTAETKRRSINK